MKDIYGIKKMRNERLIAFYTQRLVKIENAYKDNADSCYTVTSGYKNEVPSLWQWV